jgi:hypothetical protein
MNAALLQQVSDFVGVELETRLSVSVDEIAQAFMREHVDAPPAVAEVRRYAAEVLRQLSEDAPVKNVVDPSDICLPTVVVVWNPSDGERYVLTEAATWADLQAAEETLALRVAAARLGRVG